MVVCRPQEAPAVTLGALDPQTGQRLADVFDGREDHASCKLKAVLAPLGIRRFYTAGEGASPRHLDPRRPVVSKRSTQRRERKYLMLRTRLKRLVRRTLYFSTSTDMHDLLIGLYSNRFEFSLPVSFSDIN